MKTRLPTVVCDVTTGDLRAAARLPRFSDVAVHDGYTLSVSHFLCLKLGYFSRGLFGNFMRICEFVLGSMFSVFKREEVAYVVPPVGLLYCVGSRARSEVQLKRDCAAAVGVTSTVRFHQSIATRTGAMPVIS